MSNDPVVYRSTQEAAQQWSAKVDALEAEARIAFADFRERYRIGPEPKFWGTTDVILGITWSGSKPPKGWRFDPYEDGVAVPDRRSRTGKQAARDLAEIPVRDSRRFLPGGMPASWFTGLSLMQPGVALMLGRLYVKWPRPLEDAPHIDPEVWEQVSLAEYYQVRETAAQMQETVK